jgi:hypothetical protein
LIRYRELELAPGAIAELAIALRDADESALAHKLGHTVDRGVDELLLDHEERDRILRVLTQVPIPGLEQFTRLLSEQSRGPRTTEGLAAEVATHREKRLAANEAFFRDINRRLEEATPDSKPLIVLCECADEDCAQRLELTRTEYTSVRADPRHFAVAHGHAELEIEETVARTDRFEVVRKLGVGGAIAARLDETDGKD